MKQSNYNIIVNCQETDDVIIFNTLYGSLTIFEQAEFQLVRQQLDDSDNNKDGKIKDALIQQKYLISNDVDEFSIIKNRKRLGMKDKNRLDIIIMPTLECNFSCIYCYESNKNGKMTDDTQERIKQWMSNEIPKFKVVMLHWFGGEPLLSFKRIAELTKHANTIAEKNNVFLVKHITTNGYNLSESKIKTLLELGILSYQITIDGVPNNHNKLRPLRNGKATFERIFNNIIQLASMDKSVKITVRINFNHSNLHEIPNLLKMFPQEYRNQLQVSYEPIFGHCEYNAVDNILTDEISNSIASYYKLAEEFGYDITIGKSTIQTGKFVYCYAERKNQVIINFNGDIFKCSVADFNQSNRVGYLREGGKLFIEKDKWNEWMDLPLFDSICTSCKFLPLCMGGCRKSRISNKTTGSNCALIPANTSYVLKQISFKGFDNLIMEKIL